MPQTELRDIEQRRHVGNVEVVSQRALHQREQRQDDGDEGVEGHERDGRPAQPPERDRPHLYALAGDSAVVAALQDAMLRVHQHAHTMAVSTILAALA